MNTAQLITCRCEHCSGEIEFETQRSGETITCPICAMETRLYIPGGALPPSNDPPPWMRVDGEEPLYRDTTVTVTPTRLIVGNETYAMRNITSVRGVKLPAKNGLLGLAAALFAAFGIVSWTDSKALAAFWLLLSAGSLFLFFLVKPRYLIVVLTSGKEHTAFQSPEEHRIAEILAAINQAIIAQGK